MAVTTTRRVTRRRRFNNRRNAKRRAPTNKTLNKKIRHIENNLMELKYHDTNRTFSAVSSSGSLDSLNLIVQDDTASGRTGNEITPTSIQCRLTFSTNASQIQDDFRVRYILFWDKQCNGANPTLIGASTTASLVDTGVVGDATLSPFNFNNKERYKVLLDRTIVLHPLLAATTAAGNLATAVLTTAMRTHIVKLGRMVKYNNTTAAITSIVTNSLHMVYFSDAVGNIGGVQAGYRLYYRDS